MAKAALALFCDMTANTVDIYRDKAQARRHAIQALQDGEIKVAAECMAGWHEANIRLARAQAEAYERNVNRTLQAFRKGEVA